jgi:TolB-like protein/Tfp pilus assembly protein PilF
MVAANPPQRGVSPTRSPQAASVAVLPFVNMSGDPAKDYLGDGIAEELLNDLANTPSLRVASRTSAFSFKGKSADIGEIARKLHVGAVLEGSVRQEANRVRIVAQLIDAGDGFHLWSARYDRSMNDILAVQDEIARSIAIAMHSKLTSKSGGAGGSAKRIAPNAYTAYLQGRYTMHKSGTADLLRAIAFFKQAVSVQPNYADAHASMGLCYLVLFMDGRQRDTLDRARDETGRALRLDPHNLDAQLADAQIKSVMWNWEAAYTAMSRLVRQHSKSAEAHHYRATLLQALGLWNEALLEQQRAAELDPLVPVYRDNVGQALLYLGRDTEAAEQVRRVLAMEPNYVLSLGTLCAYDAKHGRVGDAGRILDHQLLPLYADDPNTILCASQIAYNKHDSIGLREIAQRSERLYAQGALDASYTPIPYALLGDYENALRWLEKAYDDRDYGIFYAVNDPAMPAAIKRTRRWRTLMQRPAFREIAALRAQILAGK